MSRSGKTFALALALPLALATVAGAQEPARDSLVGLRPGISLGLRTGTAVAKLVSDQESATQGRITPVGGIYAEARFGRMVSLVLDVLYTEYGGSGVDPLPLYGGDMLVGHKVERTNLQTQAIEVPLQLKLRPSLSSPIVPYVSFGVSKTWFLVTTSDNFIRSDSSVAEVGVNMNQVVHKYDYAGLGAVGIEVRGTHIRWSVELFSRFGLTDFNRPQVAGTTAYSASATGVKVGFGR